MVDIHCGADNCEELYVGAFDCGCICQVPSSSSQPKLLDHRNIPPGRHLSTLLMHTKCGVRLPLPELHVLNWALN